MRSPAIVDPSRRSNVIIPNRDAPRPIGEHLRGRQIVELLKTAEMLLIRCSDGTEVRVSWRDDSGKRAGVPYLEDVRRWK